MPAGQEAGWAPEPVWRLWRREKCLALARNGTPAVPALNIDYAPPQPIYYVPYFTSKDSDILKSR
jgi:hypothetical protein